MSRSRKLVGAPPRIWSEPGALGELVRAAQSYTPPLDQSAAFAKLVERARKDRTRSWRTPPWALGFATACAVVVIAVLSIQKADGPERRAEPGAAAPAPRHEQAAVPAPTGDTARELPAILALPAGESRLDDGSHVRLAEASSARIENGLEGVRIGLEQGTLTVDVAKQAKGRTFEVRAQLYRFVAIGTSFTVSASEQRIELEVREGRVAVLEGPREIARVGAGESWTPLRPKLGPQRTASATRARPESASGSEVDCLELARARRARDAESCFVAQAAGSGLVAELALFELSRLRSDVLGDPAGALAALEEYHARFPSGSLGGEVDVSHVHLLARLGRHSELLAESARLLQAPTGRERGAELRMLRANAFRVGLEDFRSAEREYAEVEKAGGKFASDAGFYRGACLEALGDTSGAARAYRLYLELPGRAREAEARRRLKQLVGP